MFRKWGYDATIFVSDITTTIFLLIWLVSRAYEIILRDRSTKDLYGNVLLKTPLVLDREIRLDNQMVNEY